MSVLKLNWNVCIIQDLPFNVAKLALILRNTALVALIGTFGLLAFPRAVHHLVVLLVPRIAS